MKRTVGAAPGAAVVRSTGVVPGEPAVRSTGVVPSVSAQRSRFAVLNTRPHEQAGELTSQLAAAGFEVLEAPAIETVPAWAPAELAAVRLDLAAGAYAWVVLPSQNAGRLLVDELREARVVCGAASAQALGLAPALTLDSFSASSALAALRPLVRGGERILVPRAAETRGELTEGLLALGADVQEPVAYGTIAVDPSTLLEAKARVARGDVAVVTVCSPSAVQSLLAGIGRELLLTPRLICLGDTTADAARQVGLRVEGVAKKTTMGSLVEAVLAATTRPPLTSEVPSREVATGESALGTTRGGDDGGSRAESGEVLV